MPTGPHHQNRLAAEASPYLRQHASNPVDWYPWGEEAFARARAEDKPIFLSIGYSTCHWCHVMAHESFEDSGVAALLNEHFVSIKLDREERPDIDHVYMTFVQATTGHGGWPMSVWLTPALEPFYGGTYFPPEDRWGRPGFASILRALARLWRDERERVQQQGAHSAGVLRQLASRYSSPGEGGEAADEPAAEDADVLGAALRSFSASYDEHWGGFGGAPKFPQPSVLQFLWQMRRTALAANDTATAGEAGRLAAGTLRGMISGGIHDHLGGGFHRYSVDATWHVPHFEKMLYDQAQITCALIEAHQATGDGLFAQAARSTLLYVQRDLSSADGGFFSAEDADSARADGSHGEGAFYLWTSEELRAALGPEYARVFAAHHGVEANGNVPGDADPHDEFSGQNILLARKPLPETAALAGTSEAEAARALAICRARLFDLRAQRERPHRDDKIVTAWNGLMISAFARAAAVLGEPGLTDPAVRSARFLRDHLWDAAAGELRRSWCAGMRGPAGVAEDYAFLVQGLLDLYSVTFDPSWLGWAAELQQRQDERFWDAAAGGYFSSSAHDRSVLVRMKESHDGAEPSASSVAALNLIRLGWIFGDAEHGARAETCLRAFEVIWRNAPETMPALLLALSERHRPPRHIVLSGTPGEPGFQALAAEAGRRWEPGLILLGVTDEEGHAWLAARLPWMRSIPLVERKAAAYLCENFTCRLPITHPAELAQALSSTSGA